MIDRKQQNKKMGQCWKIMGFERLQTEREFKLQRYKNVKLQEEHEKDRPVRQELVDRARRMEKHTRAMVDQADGEITRCNAEIKLQRQKYENGEVTEAQCRIGMKRQFMRRALQQKKFDQFFSIEEVLASNVVGTEIAVAMKSIAVQQKMLAGIGKVAVSEQDVDATEDAADDTAELTNRLDEVARTMMPANIAHTLTEEEKTQIDDDIDKALSQKLTSDLESMPAPVKLTAAVPAVVRIPPVRTKPVPIPSVPKRTEYDDIA